MFIITPLELKNYFNSKEFRDNYIYNDLDLGITYSNEKTIFKIWAPTAEKISINFYTKGSDFEENSEKLAVHSMNKINKGVWVYEEKGDLNGIYYDYTIENNGKNVISADPYAIACGINGMRSMVVDMKKTNPYGWEKDNFGLKTNNCPIIYELHIKDFSYDKSSGIDERYRGKYLAFTQKGTTLNNDGVHITGIDYLKNLGITHVHLMPAFDYGSVDESGSNEQFNWGYDPVNYNVPEGYYSTNAFDGDVRIREFKQMILSLHEAGISVVMDVVYNHTYSLDSWFQRVVPYYYYRQNDDGIISNGSACGNDTASERKMFRNYMIQSILHWTKEYHIDGFRFDLMGLHDIDTMNEIRSKLDELSDGKNIIMYGEPWTADYSPMENNSMPVIKENISYLDERIAVFCDNTRDAIKGHVSEAKVPGFVNGGVQLENQIKSSVKAWCKCDNCENFNPKSPKQIVSYMSCHDNFTLWDKLIETMTAEKDYKKNNKYLIRVNKLAAAILFTCQGIILFQAGEEFARTKMGNDNSYNLSPELNKLDWKRAYEYNELVSYYRGLMELRYKSGVFHINNRTKNIEFLNVTESGIVAFIISNYANNEMGWKKLLIAYNSNEKDVKINIPQGIWKLLLNGVSSTLFKNDIYYEKEINVQYKSAVILGI